MAVWAGDQGVAFSEARCRTRDVHRPRAVPVRTTGVARAKRGGANGALFALLLAGFFTSRALLLLTSGATNQNWEEPVFLFSSLELQREGLLRVWDYQDDLDHGGSVPLLLLGTLWLQWWEPSVLALKWLVLAWWTVTFALFLWVVSSLFSWRAAVVGGIFWLGLSPNLVRLQVTLVGSHPESVLPALCAMGLLARKENKDSADSLWCFGVAWLATVAAWMSYAVAGWSAAIITAVLWRRLNARSLAATLAGIGVGVLPWLYQNVCRRPLGWLVWVERLFPPAAISGGSERTSAWGTLVYVHDAWGVGEYGVWITGLLAVFAVVLGIAVSTAHPKAIPVRAPRAVGSLFVAAMLCAGALTLSRIAPVPNEDYYFARFFAPLQVMLFMLAAGGVEVMAQVCGRWLAVAVSVAGAALGAHQLAPLYGQGAMETNFRQEWLRGCLVFGVAEYARAASPERACQRLQRLGDAECRERAFHGLGWSLADEYRRRLEVEPVERVLRCTNDPKVRRAVCGGLHFVLTRAPGADRPLPFPTHLAVLCRR